MKLLLPLWNILKSPPVPSKTFSLSPKANWFAVKANEVLPKLVIVPWPKLPDDLNVDEVNVSVGSATLKSKFWAVESHVTDIPDSSLLATKSWAL